MKPTSIQELEEKINDNYDNIAGIVIIKDQRLVYESYFHGRNAAESYHLASATKSITSLLSGIAGDQGLISDINQPVLNFFLDYQLKRGEKTLPKISLKDMLTMTGPYKCKSSPYTKVFTSQDWIKASLDLLGGKGEIGEFRYTPIIGPDIFQGF